MKYIADRAFTMFLYILTIIGTSSWDRDSNSWLLTTLHVLTTVMFWWWSTVRIIRHVKEDEAADDEDPKL